MVWVSSKLKRPPKSCIPRRAKMMMKRKRRRRREAMDFMEFSSEPTRLLSDAQCLRHTGGTGRTGKRSPAAAVVLDGVMNGVIGWGQWS